MESMTDCHIYNHIKMGEPIVSYTHKEVQLIEKNPIYRALYTSKLENNDSENDHEKLDPDFVYPQECLKKKRITKRTFDGYDPNKLYTENEVKNFKYIRRQKVICALCRGVYKRENKFRHCQTKLHQAFENFNQKMMDIIMNN